MKLAIKKISAIDKEPYYRIVGEKKPVFDKMIAREMGINAHEYRIKMQNECNAIVDLRAKKQVKFVTREDAERALNEYIMPNILMKTLMGEL